MGLTFSYSWIIATFVNTINTIGLILLMTMKMGLDPNSIVAPFVLYSMLMGTITF